MKMTKLLAACSALALAATAGSALAGPTRGGPAARGARTPQAGPAVQRAHAIRMAKFTKIDGKIVLTTAWIDRPAAGGGGAGDTTVVPAFDCFEGDPNSLPGFNAPTNFLTCGNNATVPGAMPGSRWYFGTANIQPRTYNDMTPASGFKGADSTRISFSWYQPNTPGNFFIAISTYEDFGTACQFPATPGVIDGVLLEYLPSPVPLPPATGTGYYADEDLTTGTTPLSLGLPADGTGAYEIEFYSDELATTLVTLPGVQPFYWGTGEDEPVPDGRAGTQEPPEFADDTAPYGGAYGATECYQMNFPTICPPVLGVMMEFWAKQTVTICYPDCTEDGLLTVGDFGCFQGKYVLGDPYADCTADGLLTVGDFGCFQGKYVLGCP